MLYTRNVYGVQWKVSTLVLMDSWINAATMAWKELIDERFQPLF